jgi:hypothetical protein
MVCRRSSSMTKTRRSRHLGWQRDMWSASAL